MISDRQNSSPMAGKLGVPREAVRRAQKVLADESGVAISSRWVQLPNGLQLHVQETGDGEPLILLHGSGNNSSSWVPLLPFLSGRRVIAVDRPGFGLSPAIEYQRSEFRQAAVAFVVGLLDSLNIRSGDIVGNSTGGIWALWTALDFPNRVGRLALVGASPLLPETSPPLPLRLMTTPGLGGLLGRILPAPTPDSVVKMMAGMGEGGTIGRYPHLVDVFVAAGLDPIAGQTSQKELSAIIRGLAGFRKEIMLTSEDLRRVENPVLLVWGDHDPIGSVEAAEKARTSFFNAKLHLTATGHAPWWGEPEETADQINSFFG